MTPAAAGRVARSAGAVGVVTALTLLAACATTPARRVPPSASGCHDLGYRGLYTAVDPPAKRRFKVRARACAEGPMVLEVRGLVGGPALVAGVADGRARLLFPGRREAVEGPDLPAFWQRWVGVPLSGGLLRGRDAFGQASGEMLGEWRVTVRPGGRYPLRVKARSAAGEQLELERRSVVPAPGPPALPPVPAGFSRVGE